MAKKRQAKVLGIEVTPSEEGLCHWRIGLWLYAWAGFSERMLHVENRGGGYHKVWGPTLESCVAFSVGLNDGLAETQVLDVVPEAETKQPGSPA